jgi:hypothetical protein
VNRIKNLESTLAARRAHEQTNGHGLPPNGAHLAGGKQIVRYSPVLCAQQILDIVMEGNPMPIQIPGTDQVVNGKQPDWSEKEAELRAAIDAAHAPGEAWLPSETLIHAQVLAVAEFQRKSKALGAEATRLRAAENDALPEPPADRAPEGVDEGFGHDANGSVIE